MLKNPNKADPICNLSGVHSLTRDTDIDVNDSYYRQQKVSTGQEAGDAGCPEVSADSRQLVV